MRWCVVQWLLPALQDENIIPYYIPKGKAIDIDDIEDWEYAEKLFKIN